MTTATDPVAVGKTSTTAGWPCQRSDATSLGPELVPAATRARSAQGDAGLLSAGAAAVDAVARA